MRYCTLRLTVYSIHEAGRGGRTKGRVRLFLFFFCSLSLFFLFFLSLSSNRHANAKETDRQTDREPLLSSPRLASPRSWNSPACLKPLFPFSGFGLFPFFVPPPPLLFFFFLSPSINQSRPRSSKQVYHHHHIKWASNPPKPNSSSPRKLCANAIRISAGAIDLFIEVVDLCMLNEEVQIPIPPFSNQ